MKLTRTRVLALYIAAAYALAWAPAAWMAYEGHSWTGPFGRAVAVFQSFAPLVAALWVQGPVLKQPILEPLGLRLTVNRWWFVSWFIGPVALLIALALGWAFFGVEPVLTAADYIAMKRSLVDPAHATEFEARIRESPPGSPLGLVLMAIPAGLTVNLIPALGEEIAYRGLLFREMPGGYFQRSILIGLVWAGTLLPSVLGGHLYPDHPALGALVFVTYCVSSSLVLVYLRVRSGSTLAPALARGTMMGLTVVAVELSFGANDLVRPLHGLTGVLAMLVVLGGLYVHDRFYAEERLMRASSR